MATRQKVRRPAKRRITKSAGNGSTRRARSKSRTNGSARARATASRRQPETLRLRSVTPMYTVNDLERSVAWYRDGLGFTVKEEWKDGGKLEGVMLKAGTCTFGLSQDDFSKGRDREKGIGFRIYADTMQSVDALAKRIRAYGGKIVSEPADMSWGSRTFAVEDPDGFKISFSESRRG